MLPLCFKKYGISLLALMLFSACAIPDQTEAVSASFDSVDSSQDSLNWYRFISSDPADCQKSYLYEIEGSDQAPFVSAQLTVKKESGYEYGDYGLAFCVSDESFMAFVIDIHGYYRIIKSTERGLSTVVDWTYSDQLNTAYGSINNLKAGQSADGEFDFYINGSLIETITETELISGTYAYFAYVASENYEDLKNYPVEIYYAEE